VIELGKNKFNVPVPKGMSSFALQQRVLPVAGRIIEVIAGLLAATGDIKGLLGEDGKLDADKLFSGDVLKVIPSALPAMGRVFSEMPSHELENLTRALLSETTCDGVRLFHGGGGEDPFDLLMQGRALDTWRLLWHAIGVWYPDFFALARKSAGSLAPARNSAG
jgi:hypothetical protein